MLFAISLALISSGLFCLHCLWSNIVKAKRSGIPYLIIPFQPYTFASRLTFSLWSPLLRYTPASWGWADFMHPDLQWNKLYGSFQRLGSDTVLLCSPGQIVLHTCAADVISQVISRKDHFPKPEKLYKIVDVYGPSVISTEGHEWRKHRKALAVVYTHKTYELVWDETIRQFQGILTAFVGDKTGSRELTTLDKSVNQAALAVISCAGYGVPLVPILSLSNHDGRTSSRKPLTGKSDVFQEDWVQGKTHGHSLPYVDSIRGITSNILWIAGVPRPLLKTLPFKRARHAYSAYLNWGQYMREMVSERRRLENEPVARKKHNSDLLSSLVQSTRDKSYVTTDGSKGVRRGFADEELLADIFITMIGGHKTTASTIRFGLLLLAMNLESQRRLQQDVDRILGNREPQDWRYEQDFAPLFKGMPGAVVSEVLRWLPPILAIPKLAVADQPITVNGKSCIVPNDTLVALNVVAAHRNPKQWSSQFSSCKPKDSALSVVDCTDDLDAFRPERWLESTSSGAKASNDLGVVAEAAEVTTDAVDGIYKPVAGSYLPFSAGSRICLGRQFAQTEAVVVFALIFREFSIELSVDQWASDTEVERMDEDERKVVWLKARREAFSKFRNNVECLLSADMKGPPIPVRLVRRGHERFDFAS